MLGRVNRKKLYYPSLALVSVLIMVCLSVQTKADSLGMFDDLLINLKKRLNQESNAMIDTIVETVDFSRADQRFQEFIDDNPNFDGISFVLVDASGVIHLKTFGDHSIDLVTMIASSSKVPVVMTLLALEEDPKSNFRMDQPIGEVFSIDGVYGDRTPLQLVSNTSGIPGLASTWIYGGHLCQFSFAATVDFETCGRTMLTSELFGTTEPYEVFDYGGSQWQLAGVTASIASNKTWNQLIDEYLAVPCNLEIFTFGNMWQDLNRWNGFPDSLLGTENPHIEGGAITTLLDYAKLLQVHLNGGFCEDRQVLSSSSLERMREDHGSTVRQNPTPYGMGWWIAAGYDDVYFDPGAFGSVSFIDLKRGFGGFVAIDEYSQTDARAPVNLLAREILPMLQKAMDTVQRTATANLRQPKGER